MRYSGVQEYAARSVQYSTNSSFDNTISLRAIRCGTCVHKTKLSCSSADFHGIVRVHATCGRQANELLQRAQGVLGVLSKTGEAVHPLSCAIQDNHRCGFTVTARGESSEQSYGPWLGSHRTLPWAAMPCHVQGKMREQVGLSGMHHTTFFFSGNA